MNEYLLYLPPLVDQVGETKLICQRYEHLMKMVDREYQTCRTYIVGLDVEKSLCGGLNHHICYSMGK